jgi:hypothetical protein
MSILTYWVPNRLNPRHLLLHLTFKANALESKNFKNSWRKGTQ